MLVRRLIFLTLTWSLLLVLFNRLLGGLGQLASPDVILPVFILPWLAVIVAHGPKGCFDALADAFDDRPEDIPAARRAASAVVFRTVGSASVAGGLIGLLAGVVHTMSVVGASSGQASPTGIIISVGTSFVVPLYGLTLRTFLFEPFAMSLEDFVAEVSEQPA